MNGELVPLDTEFNKPICVFIKLDSELILLYGELIPPYGDVILSGGDVIPLDGELGWMEGGFRRLEALYNKRGRLLHVGCN